MTRRADQGEPMRYGHSVDVPATLERPPMTLHGPVVQSLPSDAAVGDLVTYNERLLMYTGKVWVPYPR